MGNVVSLFRETELQKDDYFVKIDQFCTRLSFLHEGFVRVFARAGDKEVTQWISTPGYFVTDLASFVFGQRARWNIQALTDCKLYTIEREDYAQLKHNVPDWLELERRFLSTCFITLENRVFQHLSLTAEERYDKLLEFNRELFHQVPLHYLASMLGMSPETFSRIRQKKRS